MCFFLFSCGNVNIEKEIATIFSSENLKVSLFYEIDAREYQTNLILFESTVLFRIACKKWRQVEEFLFSNYSNSKVDVKEIRNQIVQLLSLCCYNIKSTPRGPQRKELEKILTQNLRLFKKAVTAWSDLEDTFLMKLTSSSVKDCELPIYHYFHMYLDVHWLILTLHHLCEIPLDEVSSQLLKSLMKFSHTLYKKNNLSDILNGSNVICSCIDQFWTLFHLFCDKIHLTLATNTNFWQLFNNVLQESNELFSLWLLHVVSKSYSASTYKCDLLAVENYTLLDTKLKLLNSNLTPSTENNQSLLIASNLVFLILNNCWTENIKLEPYQILWEVFNKHLNFISAQDYVKLPAIKIVELVDRIVSKKSDENSYELFLYMLNKFLITFPNQWPRMRGRIYSKLPPHKINDFTDAGLFNVSLLFLNLTKNVNLEEVGDKFLSMLSNLAPERQNTALSLNIYTSLAVIYVGRNRSIKEICLPILKIVEEASEHRDRYTLIRTFVEGFEGILNSSESFCLGQHLMIGKWVVKYLKCCNVNDLCCFLDILIYNVKRIRNSGTWLEWENVLKDYISPVLKTIATSANAPLQVGELAALIDANLSSDNVLIFTADVIQPRIICQFLSTLLEGVTPNYVVPKNYETAILHAWIRCSLLNCENVDKLSKNVTKLSVLYGIFDSEMLDANKPFCAFIKCLGQIDTNQRLLSINLHELCEQCFGHIDSWVVSYIKSPISASVTIHLYTCVGLLVFHCSSLLYHKNRSNCLFNRLISTFLLPTSILMGNSPHQYILNAVHCTWHVFMRGICSLISSNDSYLERTVRDMIVRYLPLLSLDNSPLIKATDNINLLKIILDRITCSFLLQISRKSEDNVFKALKIIQGVIENETCVEKQRIIVKCTLIGLFEVIIFCANKTFAIDVFRFIKNNYCLDKEIHEYVKSSIVTVTEKHLSFYTNNYFQFANLLVQIIPTEMRSVLPLIREKVTQVEQMRGVGFDNTLRQGIDRLDILLLQT